MSQIYIGNLFFNFKKLKKNIFFLRLKVPKFFNLHKNRKILILGTGPSLLIKKKEIIDFIKTNKPIVIGCNNTPNEFKVDYRIFTNRSRFANYSNLITQSQKIILSPYFKKNFIKKYVSNKNFYYVFYKVKNDLKQNFEIDKNNIISFKVTPNVGFIAILVAYIMGGKDISIAGIDGYWKNVNQHYYNEKNDPKSIEDLLEKDIYLSLLFNDIIKFFKNKNISFNSITKSKYNSN